MEPIRPIIEPSWGEVLKEEFQSPYFYQLKTFLVEEKKQYTVYPKGSDIFNAFKFTPFNDVRVVLIGQDPYHEENQAHGLSFSVREGVPFPPSLRNIFKELHDDVGCPIPVNGNLEKWARQGVLLLNATLTVRAHQAGSHQKHGWEQFTDAAIRNLSEKRSGLVFILWGSYAQAKQALIDTQKHHVLKAVHPSPLSAHRGFFGCKHFSRTNEILISQGQPAIDWSL